MVQSRPRLLAKARQRNGRTKLCKGLHGDGIKFRIPASLDFSVDTNKTSNDSTKSGQALEYSATTSTNLSLYHNEPVHSDEKVARVHGSWWSLHHRSLISAACHGDLESVIQIYNDKKTAVKGDESKAKALQNEVNGALLHATTGKHPDLVAALLELGADAEAHNQWFPVTWWAVIVECEKMLDVFISRGVSFTGNSNKQGTIIHIAARTGNASIMHKILNLDLVDLNEATGCPRRMTALHVAIQHGRDECARLLIDAGADVNTADYQRQTALHMAAIRGNVAIVARLVQNGAIIDVLDSDDKPAWFYAQLYGHRFVIHQLGGYLNDSDLPGGKTFLHLAAQSGSIATIEYLVNKGSDFLSLDCDNKTVMMYAVEGAGHHTPHIVNELLKYKTCRDTINWENVDQQSALAIVMQFQDFQAHHENVACSLLKHGAKVDHVLPNGHSLLLEHMFCDKKRKFLIANGADLNFISENGTSLLWNVAAQNSDRAVSILSDLLTMNIDMRLSYQIQQNEKTSPFMAALERKNIEAAKLLYDSGCSLSGFHEWIRSEYAHGHSQHNDFTNFVTEVQRFGSPSEPRSLWIQARQATLGALGTGPINDKVHQLRLPVVVAKFVEHPSHY